MSRVRLASGIEIPAKPRSTQVLGHEEHGSPTRTKWAVGRTTPPYGEKTTAPTWYGEKRETQHETRTHNTHNGRGTQEKREAKKMEDGVVR